MTEREIADWEREIRHAEKMQEQLRAKQNKSKTITFAGGHSYEVPENVYSKEIFQVKDNDNEINNQ